MANTAFQKWIDTEADMPIYDNGQWVDLETGIPFSEFSSARWSPSKKAAEARGTAKFFGGKALKGSARQKEWAEKIRAEKLNQMTAEQAVMICASTISGHSTFWIDNRAKSGSEFGRFIEEKAALVKQYNSLVEKEELEAAKAAAEVHNALTDEWGFNDKTPMEKAKDAQNKRFQDLKAKHLEAMKNRKSANA